MSVFSEIGGYVKAHPLPIALGAGGLVVAYILISKAGQGSAAAGQVAQANATATSAYYAAESAQGTAGDQLQAVQIAAQAQTAQAQIAANESVTNNTTWANTDLAETNTTAASQVAEAPYAVESDYISALSQVAQLPGTTVTSTSNNSGFLGIGASSSSSTKVVANPSATSAAQELAALESLFNASS